MQRLDNGAVFAATILNIEPHPGQVRFLLDDHQIKVLVGGRRGGKTTALAVEVCYHAAIAIRERKRFRQLLIAPSVDQTRLLFASVCKLLKGSALGGLIESEVQSPFPEIRLPFDGMIFVRAAHEGGKHLRGHAADRVILDEAAYIPDVTVTEAIMPLLADTGGTLIMASTPSAKGSLFHQYFERGKP